MFFDKILIHPVFYLVNGDYRVVWCFYFEGFKVAV